MKTPHAATPTLGHWSTGEVAPVDATDAWQAALSDNYGLWQIPKAVDSGFKASIRNIPLVDEFDGPGKCILTGEDVSHRVVIAKAY